MRKRKKVTFRKRRSLNESLVIDYKDPEFLKRFITDRGKIIPRRVSGASARQQRELCTAIKRARYLSLIPFSIAHEQEKNIAIDAALSTAAANIRYDRRPPPGSAPRPPRDGAPRPDRETAEVQSAPKEKAEVQPASNESRSE